MHLRAFSLEAPSSCQLPLASQLEPSVLPPSFLPVSVTIEVDNSPRPEGWITGVTDSSPVGVVVDPDCTEGALPLVTITISVGLKLS